LQPPPKPRIFSCRLCGGSDVYLYYTLGNRGEFKYYKCPGHRTIATRTTPGVSSKGIGPYSTKPLSNFIYNRFHIGNKARALIRKTVESKT